MAFFASIPGPLFLLLYGAYLFGGLYLLRRWVSSDGFDRSPLPPPNAYGPAELGVLRGGVDGLAEVVLLDLFRRDLIYFDSSESLARPLIRRTTKTPENLSPLLREAHGWLDAAVTVESFAVRLLRFSAYRDLCNGLERLKLYRLRVEPGVRRVKNGALFALAAPGWAKLILGLVRDKPVFFLVLMIVVGGIWGMILSASVANSAGKPTARGRRLLDHLCRNNHWLNDRSRQRYNSASDPLLQVALFGSVAIAGDMAYAGYRLAVNPLINKTPLGNGGGDSYASSGTSDGGSSDGGGGCGGGGCGGCGGGGGD